MSDRHLFPVFDMPEDGEGQTAVGQYRPSVAFDYDLGDFPRDSANRMRAADGRDAYIQWCMKMVRTERSACLSYPDSLGIELEDAMAQGDASAADSALERTITEALMVNPRTEYVNDFDFDGDAVYCAFTVKGRDIDAERINIAWEAGE